MEQYVPKSTSHFKKAIKEVEDLPVCERVSQSPGYYFYKTARFNIRVIDNEENVEIHFGEKKTFDRWANSVNFYTSRSKSPKCYYPVLLPQYKWAIKVLNSKLFNFNRYFTRIDLPWFETRRNKGLPKGVEQVSTQEPATA